MERLFVGLPWWSAGTRSCDPRKGWVSSWRSPCLSLGRRYVFPFTDGARKRVMFRWADGTGGMSTFYRAIGQLERGGGEPFVPFLACDVGVPGSCAEELDRVSERRARERSRPRPTRPARGAPSGPCPRFHASLPTWAPARRGESPAGRMRADPEPRTRAKIRAAAPLRVKHNKSFWRESSDAAEQLGLLRPHRAVRHLGINSAARPACELTIDIKSQAAAVLTTASLAERRGSLHSGPSTR